MLEGMFYDTILWRASKMGSPINPSLLGYENARRKASVLFTEDEPTSKGDYSMLA